MTRSGSVNYLRNQRSRRNDPTPEPPQKDPFSLPDFQIPWKAVAVVIFLLVAGYFFFKSTPKPEIGAVIHTHNGIPIYYNGDTIEVDHGRHYAEDGYNYGQKWQCVEFVKRYLHDHLNHSFPNPFGNATHFYKPELRNGQMNVDRGMLQFHNGDKMPPHVDDVVIFADTKLGHVAIVAAVGKDYIEVVQQNIYESPRERYEMEIKDGKFFLKGSRQASGWLRLPTSRDRANR